MAQIATISLSRCGSTFLHYVISNALVNHRTLFEPKQFTKDLLDEPNLLVKLVLDSHQGQLDLAGLASFTKKIALIRDPRDRLISSFLFGLHGGSSKQVVNHIELLKRKERETSNYSFFQLLLDTNPHFSLEEIKRYLVDTNCLIQRYIKSNPQAFTMKYEDLVDSKLDSLESYLGVNLDTRIELPKRHSYAKRATLVGQWKDWFNDDDILIAKDIYSDFIIQYEYSESWAVNKKQFIPREHASEFVGKARKKKIYFESQGVTWSDG